VTSLCRQFVATSAATSTRNRSALIQCRRGFVLRQTLFRKRRETRWLHCAFPSPHEPAGRASLSSARRATRWKNETVVGKVRRRAGDRRALPTSAVKGSKRESFSFGNSPQEADDRSPAFTPGPYPHRCCAAPGSRSDNTMVAVAFKPRTISQAGFVAERRLITLDDKRRGKFTRRSATRPHRRVGPWDESHGYRRLIAPRWGCRGQGRCG
jgi:hypothetical protein